MQLAIDESLLDAEMEEEGEDDEGTIDVVDNFLTPEHFFCYPVEEDEIQPPQSPHSSSPLMQEEEEEELKEEEEEEEKEVDRELGQQWFPFWGSASDWKERYDEPCKEIKAKNKCSSRQPTYNRFTAVPLTRSWWREQKKLQTRPKREKKQEEDEEEVVDCTCYEDACGWCKVCKPKEEEEEQEEEEESNLDKEYEEEMKEGQPKAKTHYWHYPHVTCSYCGKKGVDPEFETPSTGKKVSGGESEKATSDLRVLRKRGVAHEFVLASKRKSNMSEGAGRAA